MYRTLLFLSALLCVSESAPAQVMLDPPSVKDVRKVVLAIYTSGGIDKQLIRKLAAQGLKAAGIEVTNNTNGASQAPTLNLDASLACDGGACGYRTRLWLEEPVRLVRNLSVVAKATTWSNGYGNAIARTELASLPDLISVDVNTLIALYAAEVNGKCCD